MAFLVGGWSGCDVYDCNDMYWKMGYDYVAMCYERTNFDLYQPACLSILFQSILFQSSQSGIYNLALGYDLPPLQTSCLRVSFRKSEFRSDHVVIRKQLSDRGCSALTFARAGTPLSPLSNFPSAIPSEVRLDSRTSLFSRELPAYMPTTQELLSLLHLTATRLRSLLQFTSEAHRGILPLSSFPVRLCTQHQTFSHGTARRLLICASRL
jgi:hypothetical protein